MGTLTYGGGYLAVIACMDHCTYLLTYLGTQTYVCMMHGLLPLFYNQIIQITR